MDVPQTVGALPFGEMVRVLRNRKGIRQQDLASKLDLHRNTIGSWERGECLPDSKSIVLELAKFLKLDEQETRQLVDASLTSVVQRWNVPYQRNRYFTGRSAVLHHIHELLTIEQSATGLPRCAVSGLAGVGKTQVAVEYAYLHAAAYAAIFWVSGESEETLSASFGALALLLGLPEQHMRDQRRLVEAVLRWFNSHRDWLLIIDNVEQLETVAPYIPCTRQGALLLTTRLLTLGTLAQVIELAPLSNAEGTHFLLRRVGRPEATAPQNEAASRVVELVGGLPLALDQAGAYIEETGCEIATFLHLLQHQPVSLLSERITGIDHPASVVQTFLLLFERLRQKNADAALILTCCAFLAPDGLPEEFLSSPAASAFGTELAAIVSDPLRFNAAFRDVQATSLLRRSVQTRDLHMHRLVQAVIRAQLSEEEQSLWIERVVQVLVRAFPFERGIKQDWSTCARLLVQVRAGIDLALQWKIKSVELFVLINKVCYYYCSTYRLGEAAPLFQQAFALCKEAGETHQMEAASALNGVAEVYRMQGKYEEAEALFRQALCMYEQIEGTKELQIAFVLNGLASLLMNRGDYKQGEQLYLRVLEIHENNLGEDHPLIAFPVNGLAIIYAEHGDYGRAEQCFQRALRIWEQSEEPANPLELYALNNLAQLYRDQGRNEEAEAAFQRASALSELALGAENIIMASALNGLGEIACERGQYEEAEAFLLRSLRIREQLYGAEQPAVAVALRELGVLYRLQGRFEEARQLFHQALAIQGRTLRPEHIEMQKTRERYAALLAQIGMVNEAEHT